MPRWLLHRFIFLLSGRPGVDVSLRVLEPLVEARLLEFWRGNPNLCGDTRVMGRRARSSDLFPSLEAGSFCFRPARSSELVKRPARKKFGRWWKYISLTPKERPIPNAPQKNSKDGSTKSQMPHSSAI